MTKIDWLDFAEDELTDCGDITYSLDKIQTKFETIKLETTQGPGFIVLNPNAENLWLKFAVLEFYSSSSDHSNTTLTTCFHGDGPFNGLNECRHTYWGRDGYLYYVNAPLITESFKVLSKYFDDLVEKK